MTIPNPSGKRVLVLDDDVSMGQMAAETLNHLGYKAESETCPAKSIRRILDNEFDLLLTDYRMPGLDGFQVAHILRTMGSMISVILHTGDNDSFDSDDLRLFGIMGVIKKPLPLREFSAAFSNILQLADN